MYSTGNEQLEIELQIFFLIICISVLIFTIFVLRSIFYRNIINLISPLTKEFKKGYETYPNEKLYDECVAIIRNSNTINRKLICFKNGWKKAQKENENKINKEKSNNFIKNNLN